MTPALRTPLLPLLLALLGLCCTSALPAQNDGTLRIGTWNLEHFGQRHSPPRTEADLVRLAAAIRDLNVSVLAVQEISGPDALEELASKIGKDWEFVLGTTGGWTDGKSRQSIGFLYDASRVELLHAEELLAFPRRLEDVPIFHRIPVTACFRDKRTGFDFRCVTVHFKASRGAVNEQKRRLEATTLHDWLQDLQKQKSEDQDMLVLGDFNSTYGTNVQKQLERGSVTRYLRQVRPEPTIMHFDDPIDQIAVSPGLTEVLKETFDSHSEGISKDEPQRTQWRHSYSDHFAVTVGMSAQKDEDPAAAFGRGPKSQWLASSANQAAEATVATPAPPAARRDKQWFPAGSMVTIFKNRAHLRPEVIIKGELLAPLGGHWVYLRDSNGAVHALPMMNIERITLQ